MQMHSLPTSVLACSRKEEFCSNRDSVWYQMMFCVRDSWASIRILKVRSWDLTKEAVDLLRQASTESNGNMQHEASRYAT